MTNEIKEKLNVLKKDIETAREERREAREQRKQERLTNLVLAILREGVTIKIKIGE